MERHVEKVSLCKVSAAPEQRPMLFRVADVENRKLTPTFILDGQPRIYGNRDKLYWRNGPENNGAWGVWRWTSDPRDGNPELDYNVTEFMEELQAIEVAAIPDVATIEEMIERLREGVSISLAFKTALLYPGNLPVRVQRERQCILVTESDCVFEENRLRIDSDTRYLQSFKIPKQDILSLPEKSFYRYLSLELPSERVSVRSPMEVVQQKILPRITWKALRYEPISKSDWQCVVEFVKKLPADTLTEDVADACCCSADEAKKHIAQFLHHAGQYIESASIEDQVLLSAIEQNETLKIRCEDLAEKRWRAEHRSAIQTARAEVDALEEKRSAIQADLDRLVEENAAAQATQAELQQKIQEDRQTAEQLSIRLQERFRQAREDAAAFLADMAFVHPATTEPDTTIISGVACSESDVTEYHDWNSCVILLAQNLIEAGVAEEYSNSFAAFLIAAYLQQKPLLLAGPNGKQIADAFSTALFGKTADVIQCSGAVDLKALRKINMEGEGVLVIQGAFSGQWADALPELVSQGRYCFVLHPFVEDLLVEPRELFHYIQPVFTELLIDHQPEGSFISGRKGETFEPPAELADKPLYQELLSVLPNRLMKKELQRMLQQARELDRENTDTEALIVLTPTLYFAMQGDPALLDRLSERLQLDKETKNQLRAFLRADDEA